MFTNFYDISSHKDLNFVTFTETVINIALKRLPFKIFFGLKHF